MNFEEAFEQELFRLKEELVLTAGKNGSATESGTMQVSTSGTGEHVKALVTYRRHNGFTVERIITTTTLGIE